MDYSNSDNPFSDNHLATHKSVSTTLQSDYNDTVTPPVSTATPKRKRRWVKRNRYKKKRSRVNNRANPGDIDPTTIVNLSDHTITDAVSCLKILISAQPPCS